MFFYCFLGESWSLMWENSSRYFISPQLLWYNLLHFYDRADSRFAPSQWSNAVSHWLGANLELALCDDVVITCQIWNRNCSILYMPFATSVIASLGFKCHMEGRCLTLEPSIKWPALCTQHILNAFSWMKTFVFWFQLNWSLFKRVHLIINRHWFR